MDKSDCRYYTTSVPVERSVRECIDILAEAELCSEFQQIHNGFGQTYGIRFAVQDPKVGQQPVEIMAHDKVLRERYGFDEEQSRRVAWRQIKHWIESQVMMYESGLLEPRDVFLSKSLIQDDNHVLRFGEFYENLLSGEYDDRLALETPGPEST